MLAVVTGGCSNHDGVTGSGVGHRRARPLPTRTVVQFPSRPPPASPAPMGAAQFVRHRTVFGHSVTGVPLVVDVHGDPAGRRLLVVGCIHGNESAGIGIARTVDVLPAPAGVQMWVVENLNPDGVSRHTRQNADRVDLNRNFPFTWARLGRPGDQQYAGPRPLSEPESRAVADLINRIRPDVTIWFHQPLDVVDDSGGSKAVESQFARLADMPLRRLTRYPGSAASWEDHALRGTTAFVVELPSALSAATAQRLTTAVERLMASPGVRGGQQPSPSKRTAPVRENGASIR